MHANFRLRPLSSPVTSIPSSSSSLALLSRKETEPLSLSLAVTRERISREGRFQSSPDSRLLSISTWGEGEEETAAGHRTIHAAGVSRCGPRPNEFARMLERGRSSGFLPSRGALSSICTSFASDRVPLFFGTRICGRRVASHTVISHEKRGRIPSQSDNQGLSRAISVIDEPLSNGNKRELRPSLFFFFVANGCNTMWRAFEGGRFVGRDSWENFFFFFLIPLKGRDASSRKFFRSIFFPRDREE